MVNLTNILFTIIALLAGASFVIQQAVNSNLRTEIDSIWWAGFISYLGGTIAMLLMVIVTREPLIAPSLISRSTWWSWSGGIFGAIYIAILIMLLPKLGTFTVVMLIVVAQLLTSLIFDHFGILNVPQQPITMVRIIGVFLLVSGAVLIRW